MQTQIKLPEWCKPLFDKNNRYCIIYGGRGSGKSHSVALSLLIQAMQEECLILCAREFQSSIKDSVYSLLKQLIDLHNLNDHFDITQDEIRCINGSRFIFKGLRQNIDNIKSLAGSTHLWIEEGDTLSSESWRVIKPTIRKDNSQIIVTFNPKNADDCIYREFVLEEPPDNAYVRKVNWSSNNYLPKTLDDERLADLNKYSARGDVETYNHIWEGYILLNSESQIMNGIWQVFEFEDHPGVSPYYGLDFGYSNDPTAAIRCYVHDNILYITHELYGRKIEIDEIGQLCEKYIPGFKKNKIIADSSAPSTISFMRRQGYNIVGAVKGKGSIEDGIAFIRSFRGVAIHPRCRGTINEFIKYSYKIDKHSGDVTATIIDANNHAIDATRYAVERIMRRSMANYKVLANPANYGSLVG